MVTNLVVAVVIVYLLMAVLFESFMVSVLIMLSVAIPVTAARRDCRTCSCSTMFGQLQALDMLTMLGFIILVGIVVNNAICW